MLKKLLSLKKKKLYKKKLLYKNLLLKDMIEVIVMAYAISIAGGLIVIALDL